MHLSVHPKTNPYSYARWALLIRHQVNSSFLLAWGWIILGRRRRWSDNWQPASPLMSYTTPTTYRQGCPMPLEDKSLGCPLVTIQPLSWLLFTTIDGASNNSVSILSVYLPWNQLKLILGFCSSVLAEHEGRETVIPGRIQPRQRRLPLRGWWWVQWPKHEKGDCNAVIQCNTI